MTEQTPDLPNVRDTKFLDDVLLYSAELLGTLPMSEFKKVWAPVFFGNDEKEQAQALINWEFKVASGRNKPVYLLDENNERKWIFPPLLAEMEAGETGSVTSLFSRSMEIIALRDRLKTQGEIASEKFFSSLAPKASGSDYWALKLHDIRMHCGYPYPGETTVDDPSLINGHNQTSTLTQPDEYEF